MKGLTFDDRGESVPPRRKVLHYHGDEVRVLFVLGAIGSSPCQSTGADLPLSTFGAVAVAIILVVAAGVTNPLHSGIHWFNEFLAIMGTLLFGTTAITHYRSGSSIFVPSFVYVETLAILSLVALYFATRHPRYEAASRAHITYPCLSKVFYQSICQMEGRYAGGTARADDRSRLEGSAALQEDLRDRASQEGW
jgi:hypothetical protein